MIMAHIDIGIIATIAVMIIIVTTIVTADILIDMEDVGNK
jgi:hypothetical protein